ncbi:MAG: HAD-IA family hydrolase [Thermoplasmatales archaeon]|nr:HAD-IA family hydrolase [Thermoplasmatales archaeon]
MGNLKVITFDLYGTLVDWKSSIGNSLDFIRQGLVDEFFRIEFRNVSSIKGFVRYSEILKGTLKEVLNRNNIEYEEDYGEMLVRMFSKSPFFADSIYGLIKLKRKFKIGIISNTEKRLIEITLAGVEDLFDYVITAEDTKFYKPNVMAFEDSLKIMDIKKDEILHISSYPEYDLETARKLGIRNVHFKRYNLISRIFNNKVFYFHI